MHIENYMRLRRCCYHTAAVPHLLLDLRVICFRKLVGCRLGVGLLHPSMREGEVLLQATTYLPVLHNRVQQLASITVYMGLSVSV